jgi:hypothetical protein
MWNQEKSQKLHDRRVNYYCAMFVLTCRQTYISRCIPKYACSSLISERHSLAHYSKLYKANKVLKTLVVLSGKIANHRSWDTAFVTWSERQQRSWENKHVSRVTRLLWNIRLRKTFFSNYHRMIQRTCYSQTACCFGKKNRKAQPVLESKIRAGIKTVRSFILFYFILTTLIWHIKNWIFTQLKRTITSYKMTGKVPKVANHKRD